MTKLWPLKRPGKDTRAGGGPGPVAADPGHGPQAPAADDDVDEVLPAAEEPKPVTEQLAIADRETERLLQEESDGGLHDTRANRLGEPFDRRSPFYMGFTAALGVLLAYGLILALVQLKTIVLFIVVALLLALGLEPLVSRLMSLGLQRGRSVLIVMVLLVGLVVGVGWLIVPTMADQITTLIDRTPGYLTDLQRNHVVRQIDQRFHVADRLQEQAASSLDAGSLTKVVGGLLGAGKAFVDATVAIFTVLVLTLYFMAALPAVKAAVYKLVPTPRRARTIFIGEEVCRRVGGYVLGQACVATINGFLAYIMLIVLGLPFPAILALFVGLLALVPIVGTLVGGVVVTLVALTHGWVIAAIALAYYVLYHLFEAYVLSPRIMHRAVDVPAVVTIVAVLAGGTLLGFVGALIAIPIAAALLLIYEQVLVPSQQGLDPDTTVPQG
jgi:predicted PurR-regulated permease PerM